MARLYSRLQPVALDPAGFDLDNPARAGGRGRKHDRGAQLEGERPERE